MQNTSCLCTPKIHDAHQQILANVEDLEKAVTTLMDSARFFLGPSRVHSPLETRFLRLRLTTSLCILMTKAEQLQLYKVICCDATEESRKMKNKLPKTIHTMDVMARWLGIYKVDTTNAVKEMEVTEGEGKGIPAAYQDGYFMKQVVKRALSEYCEDEANGMAKKHDEGKCSGHSTPTIKKQQKVIMTEVQQLAKDTADFAQNQAPTFVALLMYRKKAKLPKGERSSTVQKLDEAFCFLEFSSTLSILIKRIEQQSIMIKACCPFIQCDVGGRPSEYSTLLELGLDLLECCWKKANLAYEKDKELPSPEAVFTYLKNKLK